MKRIKIEMLTPEGNSIQNEINIGNHDKLQISYPSEFTFEQADRLWEYINEAFESNKILCLPDNVKLHVIHVEDED